MIVFTLRTDKPEAELGVYDNQKRLAYIKWRAHLKLSKTIHEEIEKILNKSSISLKGLKGIVCYSGPGSFTGLRIGLSVANALSYSYNIPIVATTGDDWIKTGLWELTAGKNNRIALPKYSSPAATFLPRK